MRAICKGKLGCGWRVEGILGGSIWVNGGGGSGFGLVGWSRVVKRVAFLRSVEASFALPGGRAYLTTHVFLNPMQEMVYSCGTSNCRCDIGCRFTDGIYGPLSRVLTTNWILIRKRGRQESQSSRAKSREAHLSEARHLRMTRDDSRHQRFCAGGTKNAFGAECDPGMTRKLDLR